MCVGKFSDTKIKILSDERCSCTFNCLSSYQPLYFSPLLVSVQLCLLFFISLSLVSLTWNLYFSNTILDQLYWSLNTGMHETWNYVYENCDGVTLMCHHNKTGWGENGLVDSSLTIKFTIFEYKRWVDIKEKMGPPPLPEHIYLPTCMLLFTVTPTWGCQTLSAMWRGSLCGILRHSYRMWGSLSSRSP